MAEAAFDWLLTRDRASLEKARWRATRIAQWDSKGHTGHSAQPQVSRDIAFALALTYDWLYAELSLQERALLRASIFARWRDIVRYYVAENGQVLRRPEDLLGWINLGKACAISALMRGEEEFGQAHFDTLLPLYLQAFERWTSADGGFAPGTSYALSGLELQLPIWDVLHRAAGVNLLQPPWVMNLPRFFLEFTPPGLQVHAFGDGAESAPSARMLYALAQRSSLPEAKAYLAGVPPQNQSFLVALAAPFVEAAGAPAPARNSALFASVGWAALRSGSGAQANVAVHFKSSPFGSSVHSHADQNSFTLQVNGKPVLIDSGYYDWWGSPHWQHWYTQTRAHNAVTYNGGAGQRTKDATAAGRIVSFGDNGQYAYVTGDAAAAYSAPIQVSQRALVYRRPDVLVIIDRLVARQSVRWEWNLHTRTPLNRIGRNRFRFYDTHAKAGVCMDVLEPTEFDFTQSDRFTASPEQSASRPAQWHSVIATKSVAEQADFVVSVRVDCTAADITWQQDVTNAELSIQLERERFRLLPDARLIHESLR
jgi:hypothetical protein